MLSDPFDTIHLTQMELAERWRVSHRTLERWRQRRVGVPYLKIGNRVAYRLADIEQYELERRQLPDAVVG